MKVRAAVALLTILFCGAAPATAQDEAGVRLLLARLEGIVLAGDATAYLAALGPSANRTRAGDFVSSELMPGANRAVVHERDRVPLPGTLAGSGYSVMVDVIVEFGSRARIATWRIDTKRTGAAGTDSEWTISDQ
jgi:hypothetical protein